MPDATNNGRHHCSKNMPVEITNTKTLQHKRFELTARHNLWQRANYSLLRMLTISLLFSRQAIQAMNEADIWTMCTSAGGHLQVILTI